MREQKEKGGVDNMEMIGCFETSRNVIFMFYNF